MSKILGLIPARGGSKGIPYKNANLLAGKPMIAWSIETAIASNYLDRVVVSTDSPDIMKVAKHWGAEVPFLRPDSLATDSSSIVDVALHTLDWLAETENYDAESMMLLQPTSPLRSSEDIDNAIKLQTECNGNAVVSVREVVHPPYWLRRINAQNELIEVFSGQMPLRRQDAEPLYEFNGAIYLIRVSTFRQFRNFVPDSTLAYIMPLERSLDIDTSFDFYLAQLILNARSIS